MIDDPQGAYDGLIERVDQAFATTRARWPSHVRCRATCSGCCHIHLKLLPLEAERVAQAIRGLAPSMQARVRQQGQAVPIVVCPLLVDGRCAIYAQRPLVCRTQGLPLRFQSDVEVCELNFTAPVIPQDAILDADAVNDELVALNFLARRAQGRGAGEAVSMATLVREATESDRA